MMNTNDAVNEILKRKTAIIQEKRSRIKKLTVVMTLIVLCIGIGTASWMIGTNKTDAPNKPPKVTYGIAANENTESKKEVDE